MKTNLIVMAAAVIVGSFLHGEAFAQRRVVVWSEGTAPKAIYPHDINGAVAEGLAHVVVGTPGRLIDYERPEIDKSSPWPSSCTRTA